MDLVIDSGRWLSIWAVVTLGLALAGCGDDDAAPPIPGNTATPTATAPATASPTRDPGVVEATYGYAQSRPFFASAEARITAETVLSLRPKWRYVTAAVVTAAPTVAAIDVPSEGRIKVVFIASWDGNLYALRASNGSQLWHYAMKPHPGASFPQASSAEVVRIGGEQRVYVAGGMTVYCLAAATGALRWTFDAGTGCTTCDFDTERNEVLSSPTVADGRVYFGMDVNDDAIGKGGAYAVDAHDGRLVWFFDLESGSTCRPLATDNIHRFDGYHSETELGLPAGFFSTRSGCAFDRTGTGCGNVWSSFAIDRGRRLIYTASSNCDTDDDPNTALPPPPMPPYDEAIFALSFDGAPSWRWRLREVDNDDLAFGGVPNLFSVRIGGAVREVVGVGNKDGTYYLLDRDGVNELTGRTEPYWQTNVVPGGAIGGIIASSAVGQGRIFFGTAIGLSIEDAQRPSAWALDQSSGAIVWSNDSVPSFGPTTAVPGVAFMGNIVGSVYAFDTEDGDLLHAFALGGPASSAMTVLDGEAFVGDGTGARGGSPAEAAFQTSLVPSPVTAFCLPDAPDCPEALCDDGDPCTYDFHAGQGCDSEAAPDGIPCQSNDGACVAGACVVRGG